MAEDLISLLQSHLPPQQRTALDAVRTAAEAAGVAIYLVGGGVRDLLLGRPQVDLDLVVEGDAIALARKVAAALGGRVVSHRPFGTATVEDHGLCIDLATARREVYLRPGALPVVRPASLDDDLARRDFTINAMAIALTGQQRGPLIDTFGGREDLARQRIRVLHEGSFRDDATRILRALRYEARLGFRLDGYTQELARRDAPYLGAISGHRRRRELLLILDEGRAADALRRCQELDVLRHVDPVLAFEPSLEGAFRRAPAEVAGTHLPEVYLALLAVNLAPADAAALAERLGLTARQRRLVTASAEATVTAGQALARPDVMPSAVARALAPFPPESLWALHLAFPDDRVAARVRRYLREWRHIKPHLDGRALKALGVLEGPLLGSLLARLADARLDGLVAAREDEVRLVREALVAMTPQASQPAVR